MITLPETFTPLKKYPGYFWDTKEQQLYSIKKDGELKKLKPRKYTPHLLPYRVRFTFLGRMNPDELYYSISHHGSRKYISHEELKKLTIEDYEIPKGEK